MTRSITNVIWQALMTSTTCTHVSSAVLLLFMFGGAVPVGKDRIFVDQWSPTRSQLFIADADGTNARTLVAGFERDYNASISFDGQWVVFTSERNGSADIFRVQPDGMGLEQLTDDPAYDDQAALSPDGSLLAFVSTRDAGSTDIYLLDLNTRRVRNLTDSPGGDFRPSWSPDGQTLAFSSDRGTKFQMAAGHWEHVHPASVYLLGVDGQGLRKLSPEGQFAGSPKWSPDGTRVVFYELAVADTFRARQLGQQPRLESRIVSVDVATGARLEHASGPGLKVSPQFLGPDRIGYLAKSGLTAALVVGPGETGSVGDIGNPAWSHDGTRVVYHSGQIATMAEFRSPGEVLLGRDPQVELIYASGFPAVSPDGRHLVLSERTRRRGPDDRTQLAVWDADGTNPRRIFRAEGSAMAPQWSSDGQWIAFGVGNFFLGRTRPAQVMLVKPDGSEARALTTGPGNAGFPGWSPDGTQVVYRFWSDTAGGLRIVGVADGAIRTLTTGYDNFPSWSPQGDRIVFSRLANDDFDIYTIRPDGTGLTQLAESAGNDSHPAWSADGAHILFSSSRFGFKDEAPLADIPQPYGELFVMRADGSEQRALTDNQWEEGTPAWQPAPPNSRLSTQGDDAHQRRGLQTNTAAASPGYVLFNPSRSLTTYLVDLEGQVVHTWQHDHGPGGGAYLLENGHLLRGTREPDVPVFSGGGQSGRLQEITWDGEVVWDFTFTSEDHLLHHDVAVMPNGNILAIAWEQKSARETNQAGRLPALTPEAGLWPDMIVEFEPQAPDGARIVWEWHMWNHTLQNHDPDADNYGELAEHPELIDINGDRDAPEMSAEEFARVEALGYVPEDMDLEGLSSDFLHTNAVNYNAALDQIVMSVPRFNEIWVIDHSTTTEEAAGHTGGRWGRGGDLLYRWGNPRAYGRGDEAAQRLGYQHDVRWVPAGMPGAGHLTLFNNNVKNPDGDYSAVFELAPPTDDVGRYVVPDAGPLGPEEPIWMYVAPNRTQFFSRRISGTHRLATGHTFITSGRPGRLFEVTPKGQIVWEYWNPYAGTLPGNQPTNNNPYSVFRATKIAPDHPALAGRDLTPFDPQPAFVPPPDPSP